MMFSKVTALMGALAFTLTGCASMSSGEEPDYSNVDPSLTQDEANFFSESGWTACAIGAGLGALTCIIRGGDSGDMLACSAIAVPAGCGIFMGGNYLLDEVRVNYKTKEAQLDHVASLVKQDNEKLRNLNQNAEELLKRDRAELAKMEKDLAAGAISADDLNAKLADMDDNIRYLSDSRDVAKQRLEDYQHTRDELLKTDDGQAKATLSAADREALAQLNTEIAELEEAIQASYEMQMAYSETRNSLHVS